MSQSVLSTFWHMQQYWCRLYKKKRTLYIGHILTISSSINTLVISYRKSSCLNMWFSDLLKVFDGYIEHINCTSRKQHSVQEHFPQPVSDKMVIVLALIFFLPRFLSGCFPWLLVMITVYVTMPAWQSQLWWPTRNLRLLSLSQEHWIW